MVHSYWLILDCNILEALNLGNLAESQKKKIWALKYSYYLCYQTEGNFEKLSGR